MEISPEALTIDWLFEASDIPLRSKMFLFINVVHALALNFKLRNKVKISLAQPLLFLFRSDVSQEFFIRFDEK